MASEHNKRRIVGIIVVVAVSFGMGCFIEAVRNRNAWFPDSVTLVALIPMVAICGVLVRRAKLSRSVIFSRRGWLATVPIAATLTLIGYVYSDVRHDNLRIIADGQVLRCGQMDGAKLARFIRSYHVRSVLNLRGTNPTAAWYKEELRECAGANVEHYDRKLSSVEELTIGQMEDIVGLMRAVPKPLLIHCEGGADRSGLGCTLYRFAVQAEPADRAIGELSIWNGHVPLVRPHVVAMDHSFWKYVTNHSIGLQSQRISEQR